MKGKGWCGATSWRVSFLAEKPESRRYTKFICYSWSNLCHVHRLWGQFSTQMTNYCNWRTPWWGWNLEIGRELDRLLYKTVQISHSFHDICDTVLKIPLPNLLMGIERLFFVSKYWNGLCLYLKGHRQKEQSFDVRSCGSSSLSKGIENEDKSKLSKYQLSQNMA